MIQRCSASEITNHGTENRGLLPVAGTYSPVLGFTLPPVQEINRTSFTGDNANGE